jgi:hypothetical protein
MVQRYGAKAVFVYEGLIAAAKVEDAIVSLGEKIKGSPNASLVDTLRTLLQQHELNGVWTISYLFSLRNPRENA